MKAMEYGFVVLFEGRMTMKARWQNSFDCVVLYCVNGNAVEFFGK